jgi:hypothetical protein
MKNSPLEKGKYLQGHNFLESIVPVNRFCKYISTGSLAAYYDKCYQALKSRWCCSIIFRNTESLSKLLFTKLFDPGQFVSSPKSYEYFRLFCTC